MKNIEELNYKSRLSAWSDEDSQAVQKNGTILKHVGTEWKRKLEEN